MNGISTNNLNYKQTVSFSGSDHSKTSSKHTPDPDLLLKPFSETSGTYKRYNPFYEFYGMIHEVGRTIVNLIKENKLKTLFYGAVLAGLSLFHLKK